MTTLRKYVTITLHVTCDHGHPAWTSPAAGQSLEYVLIISPEIRAGEGRRKCVVSA